MNPGLLAAVVGGLLILLIVWFFGVPYFQECLLESDVDDLEDRLEDLQNEVSRLRSRRATLQSELNDLRRRRSSNIRMVKKIMSDARRSPEQIELRLRDMKGEDELFERKEARRYRLSPDRLLLQDQMLLEIRLNILKGCDLIDATVSGTIRDLENGTSRISFVSRSDEKRSHQEVEGLKQELRELSNKEQSYRAKYEPEKDYMKKLNR